MKNKFIIPKGKISGQRMGQIIFDAIWSDFRDKNLRHPTDEETVDILYNLENKDLQKLINKYLKKYE